MKKKQNKWGRREREKKKRSMRKREIWLVAGGERGKAIEKKKKTEPQVAGLCGRNRTKNTQRAVPKKGKKYSWSKTSATDHQDR